jgi:hypothetical protein
LATPFTLWPDRAHSADITLLNETPNVMSIHVSVENQVPEDLRDAIGHCINDHPQWDR